ncbi:C-type lectin domain family 4 member M-like isoform X1 [Polypterus senegalus]|uniref:C-type lectin domain family 4 member M-like isoform X1 n=1 Tax=Polypterus senegalus TaxID=55291 RepID=UPI00196261D9|nr:C-type lectin domain family 4 member M-like isoform X1 [Polypterus senegalus]
MMENIYMVPDKSTEAVYENVGLFQKTSTEKPQEAAPVPASVDHKPLRLKLLFIVCAIEAAIIVAVFVYYFITLKPKDFFMEKELNHLNDTFHSLSVNYSITSSNLTSLQKSYMELLNRNHEIIQNYSYLQSKNLGLNQTLANLQIQQSLLNKKHSALQTQFSSLNRRHAALSAKFDKYCSGRDPSSQERICSVCPERWLPFKSQCYFFSTDTMTWNASLESCKSMGGNLVIIESEEEQRFLEAESKRIQPGDANWIGLTDMVTEGKFQWVDSRPLDKKISFWFPGQPENTPAHSEDCVQLMVRPQSIGWHDFPCESQAKRICEAGLVKFRI